MSLLILASPVAAQFAQLAATDDGSEVYFTTQMVLKGQTSATPGVESRLYHFGPSGVTLFAERGALAPEGGFSSSDGVDGVTVSGDGSLVSFTFNDVCASSSNCVAAVNDAELRGTQNLDLGPGNVEVSRNGRWALVWNLAYGEDDVTDPPRLTQTWTCTLIDLTTGQRTPIPSQPFQFLGYGAGGQAFRMLASDGTVLIPTDANAYLTDARGAGYSLWKQGKATALELPAEVVPVALSDDASAVICYGSNNSGKAQILTVNLATGKVTVGFSAQDSQAVPILMGASSDGTKLLYRVSNGAGGNGPAYLWGSIAGTMPVPLADGETVTDGTLTGSGGFAFLATTQFRLVKFSAQFGTVAPLFSQTAYCDDPGAVAGGSRVLLHCSLPASVQDHIFYDFQPMPLLDTGAGVIAVQIPWQWDNFTPPTLSFDLDTASPFQSSQSLNVWDGAPAMVPADPGQSSLFGIKIVKGDWSGPVTTQPAPGDIVTIYMTGLGWTQSPEQTGAPASLVTPNPIQWGLSCTFLPQQQPAQLLFAGLAPGTVGVYQTTFRVLADGSTSTFTGLSCSLASPSMTVTFGPGTPAPWITGSPVVFEGLSTGRKSRR